MTRIVILGAGGHGREALAIAHAAGAHVMGFLDDGLPAGASVGPHGLSVLGGIDALQRLDASYVAAIGDPAARRRIDERVTTWGRAAARLIHPDATVVDRSSLAPGVIIAAGARISTNVRLGRHTHVNLNATVSHDTTVGDHAILGPGSHLSGGVIVGDGVWIGMGACVNQSLKVGEDAIVGSGAVVTSDIPAHVTVVGVPARPIRKLGHGS